MAATLGAALPTASMQRTDFVKRRPADHDARGLRAPSVHSLLLPYPHVRREHRRAVQSTRAVNASTSRCAGKQVSSGPELSSGLYHLLLETLACPPAPNASPFLRLLPAPEQQARPSPAAALCGAAFLAAAVCIGAAEPAAAAEASQGTGAAESLALVQQDPSLLHNVTAQLAEGPFWDNVARFMVYFVTVFTGGLYSLVKPVYELAKNPVTLAILVLVLGGSFALMYFTLSAMLGLNEADVSMYT